MSEAMSSAVRFEDHFGPIEPEAPGESGYSTPIAPLPADPTDRLRHLADHMRRSVVQATTATDVTEKSVRWDSYRTARTEALALLASVAQAGSPPRLHSV
jgi:hypothetical protein